MPKYKPENECISKQKSNVPKKKKIYVVEAMYVGRYELSCFDWFHNGEWFIFKKYETKNQRDNAVIQFNKQFPPTYMRFRKGTP